MRRYLLLTGAALLAIGLAGCNPFGTDELKVYTTGTIYVDSTWALPAQGVGVMVSGANQTIWDYTDASGSFFIEIQIYPEEQGGGGRPIGTDESTPGTAHFTVSAFNGEDDFQYGAGANFIVEGGDTLYLPTISLTDFESESGPK